MGRYPRQEILAAFESYKRARDEASQTGDWNVWADCFTKDAHYVEHAYGEFRGRKAIQGSGRRRKGTGAGRSAKA